MATTKKSTKLERKEFVPDVLDLQVKRKMIMIAGRPSAGKSYSVADLCMLGLEQGFKVMVIDRDRGLAEVIEEVCGGVPDNLVYKVVREWSDLESAMDYASATLGPKDWLVFEHVGRLWDFAQSEYVKDVYGTTHAQRLRMLRSEAEAIIREEDLEDGSSNDKKEANRIRNKQAGYGGLDGRRDWGTIKASHNGDVMDKWLLDCDFNVLSTTSITKLDTRDENQVKEWEEWRNLGVRPEGEKHNRYRHSTIAFIYKKNGKFFWRTDLGKGEGKDRGKELMRDVDMTGVGFVRSWMEAHGLLEA